MPAPRVPVELREFPEPALEPGSLLLSTLYSEVCGTDVHIWHGRLAGVPFPIIPGHVSVGIAAKVRGDVRGVDGAAIVEGDRLVFFDVHRTCGRCRACAVTRTPTRCEARRVYGITDPASEGLFGGWAEAIYLEPGVSMAKLPDSVPAETYISGGCGLITAVHAVDRASLILGDSVLVQGTGAVGLSAIALARLAGATRVIAFGAPADRLELATAMGADHVVDVQRTEQGERAQIVRDLTGGLGVDVAIEAAGSARAVEEALDLIRDGGRYVIAGHYTERAQRDQRAPAVNRNISRSAAAGGRVRISSARCACSNVTTRRFPGARSVHGPIRCRNSIRRSPTPTRCIRETLVKPADARSGSVRL
jgi:L-iditol 2-dehydrogenase